LVAEDKGDLSHLVKLLRTPNLEMREGERELLARLLERRVGWGRPPPEPGRPRAKLFTRTAEARLKWAADFVRQIMRDYLLPKDMSVTEYLEWGKKQRPPKKEMTTEEYCRWQEECLLIKDGRKISRKEAIEWFLIVFPDEAEWFSSKGEPGGKLANYLAGKRGVSRRKSPPPNPGV
jgi:hypothetical protein